MAKVRTFVALDTDPEVRRRVAEVIDELSGVASSLRWVQAKHLHLTLKFLGDVRDNELYDVCQAVSQAASQQGPIPIRYRDVGAFPSLKRPRTLWIGVDGDDPLVKLQANIDACLFDLGFPRESRSFHPHLTIGRVPQRSRIAGLDQLLAQYQHHDFGRSVATECVVYSSELSRQGPVYTPLGHIPLTG